MSRLLERVLRTRVPNTARVRSPCEIVHLLRSHRVASRAAQVARLVSCINDCGPCDVPHHIAVCIHFNYRQGPYIAVCIHFNYRVRTSRYAYTLQSPYIAVCIHFNYRQNPYITVCIHFNYRGRTSWYAYTLTTDRDRTSRYAYTLTKEAVCIHWLQLKLQRLYVSVCIHSN